MKSISRQILIYLLGSLGCLLGVIGCLLYFAVDRTVYHEFDRDLRRQAELLAAQVNTDEHGKIRLDLTLVPGRFSARTLLVLDASNKVIYRSADALDVSVPVAGFNEIELQGEPYRTYTLTSKAQPDEDDELKQRWPAVPFTLIYGKSLEVARRVNHIIAAAVVGAAVLSAGLATVVIVWAVRKGLSPLEALGEQLQKLDAQSLGRQITLADNPAELQPVVERLNDLMQRLNDAFERQQRFTSNAAHEFRTPIAEIRSTAEVALTRPWLGEAEKISFKDVLDSTVRMQNLISALLSLARDGEASAAMQPIDLRSAIGRTIQRLPPADASAVRVEAVDSAVVGGMPEALDGILLNLLQNAIEYREGRDPVVVSVRSTETETRIEIVNNVDADALTDVARFGEQFWRKSNSRTDGRHSGLGCALTKMYAGMTGGQVQWNACPSGRPRIVSTVTLPAAAASG